MCLRPLRAEKQEFGRPKLNPDGELMLPCGTCHECISLRASDFATRTQHELGDHTENCCVTLTYENGKLPSIDNQKIEFQKFFKRLRERTGKKLLYLCSHEYGSRTQRLHHHALIFGMNFRDMQYWKTTPKGTKLYTSRDLTKTWKNGWANIGEASVKAGYYIASYALKNSKQRLVDENGEIREIRDTMSISKKPGIGLNYLRKHHRQLAELGERLPRYYVKKLGEILEMPLPKILSLTSAEINLRYEMLDSLSIYEQTLENEPRTPRDKYNKYEILRSKLRQDGDFRKKAFTREDQFEKTLLSDQFYSSLTLEDQHERTHSNRYSRPQN